MFTSFPIPTVPLFTVARTLLTSNVNYYVSTTGSDSNPGTQTLPWATLTHASNFLAQNIDAAQFNITLNIGAGTFQGCAIKLIPNIGVLQINGAGSGSTTVTAGPNDGVFNFGESFTVLCPNVGINKLTATTNVTNAYVFSANAAAMGFTLGDFVAFTGTDLVIQPRGLEGGALSITGASAATGAGNITINMGGINALAHYIIITLKGVLFDFAAWKTTGTPDNAQDFLIATEDGTYLAGAGSGYTATAVPNCLKAQGIFNGQISSDNVGVDLGPNWFPGSGGLNIDGSSFYDRGIGSFSAAGAPTTTTFPNPGTGGYYIDTNTSNVYATFNQGGTIKKVQLV